jgi:predicted O-linked N-acetylglucosamine transferase (SPINDLY family)
MLNKLSEAIEINSTFTHKDVEMEKQLDIHWGQLSGDALKTEDYSCLIDIYEKVVESDSSNLSNCFYLGLAYLLNGEEDLAQMTWFSAIAADPSKEIPNIQLLSNILKKEACRQASEKKVETSWIIRQHLKEINALDIENLLELILYSIELDNLSSEVLKDLNIIEILSNDTNFCLEESFFEVFVNQFLDFQFPESIELISVLSHKFENKKKCTDILLLKVHKTRHINANFAGKICKVCSEILPEDIIILQTTCWCFCVTSNFQEAISASKVFYERSPSLIWKLISIYSLLREMTRAADWIEIDKYILEFKEIMYNLGKIGLSDEDFFLSKALPVMPGLLQYFQDNPVENKSIQKSFAGILQKKINKNILFSPSDLESYRIDHSTFKNRVTKNQKKLRIGFLVSTLKTHSVGWLSRWLFDCYDREKFDFSVFVINQPSSDPFTERWFESKVNKLTYFSNDEYKKVAKSIYLDDVDILIDMDSTTSSDACLVLALKPAPIQATWLGYDSTSIPTVDYFIVDPYLLPEDAQDYYSEKLWRLPQTYLAVDGFEVEVPTLSRRDLEIPEDAIVYLSAQTGQKRNPEAIRLQLRIMKAVSNAYLLIKGSGENSTIQELFSKLSQEEGLDLSRLRFLDLDPNEFVHRANLQIADVILDTYPYNGATTTLEALWVGVPIVTKLGQQCAARNSYTFLAQVGVTDGIATTDEEYIDWGIRFGNDLELRQKVYSQLKQARHLSPLWNTKQFARDMEAAFLEMWEIYAQSAGEYVVGGEIS